MPNEGVLKGTIRPFFCWKTGKLLFYEVFDGVEWVKEINNYDQFN